MRLSLLPLFLFGVALLAACKKDPKTGGTRSDALTSFPLSVGNDWHYHTTTTEIVTYDTSTTGPDTIVHDIVSHWTVLSDTLFSTTNASKILQVDSGLNFTYYHSNHSYYANMADGFYGLGTS